MRIGTGPVHNLTISATRDNPTITYTVDLSQKPEKLYHSYHGGGCMSRNSYTVLRDQSHLLILGHIHGKEVYLDYCITI